MSELEENRRRASQAFTDLGIEAQFIGLQIMIGGKVTIAELAKRFEVCERAWDQLVAALQPAAARDAMEWLNELDERGPR